MDYLPQDPDILISAVNMLLRDEEFETLEELCDHFDRNPEELLETLARHGYVYCEEQRQMRPACILATGQ